MSLAHDVHGHHHRAEAARKKLAVIDQRVEERKVLKAQRDEVLQRRSAISAQLRDLDSAAHQKILSSGYSPPPAWTDEHERLTEQLRATGIELAGVESQLSGYSDIPSSEVDLRHHVEELQRHAGKQGP